MISFKHAALAALIALGSIGYAAASDVKEPYGLWLRPEGGVKFSFYDCGGLLCAKVVDAARPEDKAGIGTVILRGAKRTAANEWRGKLYNSDDGKVYDGYITLTSDDELTLKGCILGVLCGGETWKRVPQASSGTKPARTAAVQ
ncbi:MAG TPA: DUF2147 domain-containing protein [Methylocystis sp.]|nr:DUF2147 domain-containing protein [Methylocystis sp.]